MTCTLTSLENAASEASPIMVASYEFLNNFFCSLVVYSGTSEQRPPSGTSLLAFVERLALVRRFCVKTPDLMFFWYILIIKSRINKQESDIYIIAS